MVCMLDCTWNDLEAQTALLRMSLKEKDELKTAANQLKQKEPQSETAPTLVSLKRMLASAGSV
jgi:hypothetical protein